MKNLLIIVTLFIGVISCQNTNTPTVDSSLDPDIIGRWDIFKTVNEDGTEVFNVMATEHYYTDGKVAFNGVMIKPHSLEDVPLTAKEIQMAYKSSLSALCTYETDQENGIIKFHILASPDSIDIGTSFEVSYKIIGDTIIWDGKYYAVRVK